MDLVKYVRQDGTGDYTDLITGFNDILVSGVAATGDITTYLLVVDNGSYSGTFSGYIPHSGQVTIAGSGTLFTPSATSTVSGIYVDYNTPNLLFQDFLFDCSNVNYAFSAPSGFGIGFEDSEFINCSSGILLDNGAVILKNTSAHGDGDGKFIYGSGHVSVESSQISDYDYAVYSQFISVDQSTLFNNTISVDAFPGHNTVISNSLLYGTGVLVNVPSGNLSVIESTLSGYLPIHSSGCLVVVSRSILVGETKVIDGTYISGSVVQFSATVPSGWSTDPNISGHRNSTDDPLFNNIDVGDFRLQFGEAAGSPYVEYVDNPFLASGVVMAVEQGQFKVADNKGVLPLKNTIPYIYRQGSAIRFTDHNQEIRFARTMAGKSSLVYQQIVNAQFTSYNVETEGAFSTRDDEPDVYPWDWDWKNIPTIKIDEEWYLIPRSVVDMEDVISDKIGELPSKIIWNVLSKANIKVYDQINYRGVSFDPKQSDVGISIMWILEGRNQTLIKQNAFSGEELVKYPLLCAPLQKSYVRPSGLVFVGAQDDQYRFVHESDPNLEIIAPNLVQQSNGTYAADVPWIPTHLNQLIDLRGVLAYKDHIFITASQYADAILDRSTIPSTVAQGRLYWYPSNDLFYNYTRRPEDDEGPTVGALASGNMYPTDISVYEDGTFLVADAYSTEVYRYKPAYDYALVQNSYDNETRVILRESYQDVNL